MQCPSCQNEVTPDTFFCNWCSVFMPDPGRGIKANLFARWVALVIDPLIAAALYFAAFAILAIVSQDLALIGAFVFPIVYLVWFMRLLRQGLTPGKKALGLQVVDHQTGRIPGFGKMFLREFVGRALSGLFAGLGYLWALIDKNGQAFHDKLAGTVVLKSGAAPAPLPASAAAGGGPLGSAGPHRIG